MKIYLNGTEWKGQRSVSLVENEVISYIPGKGS